MKVTLLRHTSLQIAEGICYGQSDIDVSANFHQEMVSAQQKMLDESFTAMYSSPLQRCHKLALGLASRIGHDRPIQLDERLKELHFGDWEMQSWGSISREVFDVWAQNYADMAPPSGETFAQLQARGVDFLQQIQTQHAGEHVLVVTHGGMIRALIAYVLNMQLKGLFRLHIDYASLTRLEFDGEIPKIAFVNR